MLKARAVCAATLAFALSCAAAVAGEPAPAPPKTKYWEMLRDRPTDYTAEARRRAANIAQGAPGDAPRALTEGFANADDLSHAKIVKDELLAARLERALTRLIPPGMKAPPFAVILIDVPADAPRGADDIALSAFNVHATDAGGIVVPLDLLRTTPDEDELDFILAHELAHIAFDHFSDLAVKQEAVSMWLGAIGMARAMLRMWSRTHEIEADALAFDMLMEYGRSAQGARAALARIERLEPAQERARRAISSLLCDKAALPAPQREAERNACALFRDVVEPPTHPSARERLQYLAAYQARWYPAQ